MKIESVDQEVHVTFQAYRDSSPRLRLRYEPRKSKRQDPDDIELDYLDKLVIIVLPMLGGIAFAALMAFDHGLWGGLALFLSAWLIPLLLLGRGLSVEVASRKLCGEHQLRLSAGGAWLDSRPCEVWLAGARLVTGDGEMYELVESPDPLRELREHLEMTAESTRERHARGRDMPAELDALMRRE